MFIPPKGYQQQGAKAQGPAGLVRLQSSHLIIGQELSTQVFDGTSSAYLVYYPDRRVLMIAPSTDETFKQLHKVTQHMLKDRNLKGDKSIALHEMLIDHQLDETDRALTFEWNDAMGILNINI